jgi:hypothetical protein
MLTVTPNLTTVWRLTKGQTIGVKPGMTRMCIDAETLFHTFLLFG